MYKMIIYKYGQSGKYKWKASYNKHTLAVSYNTYPSKAAAAKAFQSFINAVRTKDFSYE